MEEDEMDSLFDGMVLFEPNSSQLDSDSQPPPPPRPNNHDTAHDPKIEPPPSPSPSEPLDENLFSDLTVQFQPPPPPSPSPSPPPLDHDDDPIKTTSRQNSTSRKKKRAAGLRIGYARDSNSLDRSLSLDPADDVTPDAISSDSVTVSLPPQPQPEVKPTADAEPEPELESGQAECSGIGGGCFVGEEGRDFEEEGGGGRAQFGFCDSGES